MAKVRKKFNKTKHNQVLAKQKFKHNAVLFITGMDKCQLINFMTNKVVPVTASTYKFLATNRFNWSIYMASFGKGSNKHEFKADVVNCPEPYTQQELAEFLNDYHKTINDTINPKHFIGSGWLATPFTTEFNDDAVFDLFTHFGAFDRYKDPETGYVYLEKHLLDEKVV